MRLDDAVTYFLGEWPSEGPTQDTWRSYSGHLKWLVGFAAKRGQVQLADLTPELLRAAMSARMAPTPHRSLLFKGGESSAKALASAARKMARWLVAQGVPVADLSGVKSPRPPERVQPRVRPAEFNAIESAILHRLVSTTRRLPRVAIARDLALIYMLADTGLRANEVCSMDIRNVVFETGSILVIRGKGKKERALSIIDPDDPNGGVTLRLLADWIEMRSTIRNADSNTRLWVSMKGRPFNREELRRLLKRICRDAGMTDNRPPHTFRRANFTEGYLADPRSIRVLASRMGWSPKSNHMIDVYTRGVDIELAMTTPVASVSARWRKSTIAPIRPRPILLNGVGPPASYAERPGPASPSRQRQDSGRLPSSRTGRRP